MVLHIEEKLDALPNQIKKMLKENLLTISTMKNINRLLATTNMLLVLKIGNPSHPHNSFQNRLQEERFIIHNI